ncbi:Calcineurin-like phosphoesterase domain, ApaH type,Metallo-dependent phosphatase-like,5'- [Cinara cedri]|uniref:5'-nucleotidase n=1 Tax=Cinara cedri TaxID=506608 RepID=A0A5E4M6P2_9HEMI|nr:Calcineurin-like phosphoesterase domain, ApaH type,Metallo-dependent phosphatase-like,5'- [Cinara cedri]
MTAPPVARGYYWCRRGLLFSFLMMAAVTRPTVARRDFQLVLLHTNDMLSRLNQINQSGGECSDVSDRSGLCYGGFARVKTAVDRERAAVATGQDAGVLYLDAGNSFRGTTLYTYDGGISEVMKKLKPDAMCLGSHDFDDGLDNIKEFIHNTDVPIVCSNIDVTNEPLLSTETNLMKSKVIEIKGRKIGIIGYLTPETRNGASKRLGLVQIKSEIEEIKKEVNNLKNNGVKIIIALGHSGFEMDKLIAKKVIGIDIVIGGHSRTFLYNGKALDIEIPYNSYPFLVLSDKSTNKNVPVVQAYCNTKYLGKLVVDFDENGEVISTSGNPILLDHKIQQDRELLEVIKQIENPAIEKIKMVIGSTSVFLQGGDEYCGTSECNFGNFITDAFINYNIRMNIKKFNLTKQWTDASVAIIQNGVIGSNISQTNRNSDITAVDVLMALPFQNDVGKITIKGMDLKNLIEHGVSQYTNVEHSDAFLQVSGLQVVLDFTIDTSYHVRKFLVRCAECTVPVYKELEMNDDYTIIVNKYLADGGNGFQFKHSTPEYKSFGITETEIIIEEMSISKYSPIVSEISGRIVIFDNRSDEQPEEELSYSPEMQDDGIASSIGDTILDIGETVLSTV